MWSFTSSSVSIIATDSFTTKWCCCNKEIMMEEFWPRHRGRIDRSRLLRLHALQRQNTSRVSLCRKALRMFPFPGVYTTSVSYDKPLTSYHGNRSVYSHLLGTAFRVLKEMRMAKRKFNEAKKIRIRAREQPENNGSPSKWSIMKSSLTGSCGVGADDTLSLSLVFSFPVLLKQHNRTCSLVHSLFCGRNEATTFTTLVTDSYTKGERSFGFHDGFVFYFFLCFLFYFEGVFFPLCVMFAITSFVPLLCHDLVDFH